MTNRMAATAPASRPGRGVSAAPFIVVTMLVVTGFALPGQVLAFEAAHELTVSLDPVKGMLTGTDRILLSDCPLARVPLGLAARIRIQALEVNGRARNPIQTQAGPAVSLSTAERDGPVDLVIRYEGLFQDEVPVRPVNTDNPGYGVSGTISPRGTLLLGGAGWYPAIAGAVESVRLRVIAPLGTSAVTAGRSTGVAVVDGRTVSSWEIAPPAERLALAAGRYVITRSRADVTPTATYFLADDPDLAATYLSAAADYIALYADRFGPYPFPKFAVVENFFPTGYGFPSYTLIGGRVLRLPFIVETSLGHEIAHCWWGNGVRVDGAGGNWSEGLTSYVAEHLYQEMASEEAAREHRSQLLRNYAALVPPEADFALRRFTHRFTPPSKAVGYDKSAMVFHMLRRTIGDDAFQEGLRRLYAARLHRETDWGDLQQAFEDQSGEDLNWFFRQWLDRPGAPFLWLENVQAVRLASDRYRVDGLLRQRKPYYRLTVPLELTSAHAQAVQPLAIADGAAPFTMTITGQPQRMEGDPGNDVFRRLAPEEMPATVNALRRKAPLLVIVPQETVPGTLRRTAETLAQGLGRGTVSFVREADLDDAHLRNTDLLVMGRPQNPALAAAVGAGVALESGRFELRGKTYEAAETAFFGVWRHPLDEDRVMAVLAYAEAPHGSIVARKIPHYGRYSYLVFEGAANRVKGVWEAAASPLAVTWPSDPARP